MLYVLSEVHSIVGVHTIIGLDHRAFDNMINEWHYHENYCFKKCLHNCSTHKGNHSQYIFNKRVETGEIMIIDQEINNSTNKQGMSTWECKLRQSYRIQFYCNVVEPQQPEVFVPE